MCVEPHERTSPPSFTHDASVEAYNVSEQAFLSALPGFEAVEVCALVVRPPRPDDPANRVLLIGNCPFTLGNNRDFTGWRIPGGAYRPGDDVTLLDCLARTLREDTGLRLRHVDRAVEFSASKDEPAVAGGASFVNHVGKRTLKFSFLVQVEEPAALTLEPGAQVWVSYTDIMNCIVIGTEITLPFSGRRQFAFLTTLFRDILGDKDMSARGR